MGETLLARGPSCRLAYVNERIRTMSAKTVELHLLQSFPPSCVNRDGNNSPKDCIFGDVRRARISSQCLKRAIRQTDIFSETIGEAIASRSKQMRDRKLVPYLLEKGLDQA